MLRDLRVSQLFLRFRRNNSDALRVTDRENCGAGRSYRKNREVSKEDVEYLILDATEQPVQRPKKGQWKYYSGKKKKHTLKTQYIVGPDGKIYAVSGTYPGSIHDFTVYKDQKNRDRFLGIPKKCDSGYQGIKKYDRSADTPVVWI